MSKQTRFAWVSHFVGLALLASAAARADYPDYAPAPPGRGDAGRPAELRRPLDAPRALRQPDESRGAADSGQAGGKPRQLPVRFQPVDYQEPSSAETTATSQPAELQPTGESAPVESVPTVEVRQDAAAEPLPIGDGGSSIPLSPETSQSRSLWHNVDLPPWLSGAGSLGIVLGLFLLMALVVRRGMPKNLPVLPREAVEVLGRAPLFGREQVYLIRCANKVVLVAASAGKLETLTEVTDPAEVDRLSGIGQQSHPHSATASFRQVFEQFGQRSARREFMSRPRGDLDFGDMDGAGHYAAGERV
jgi:flagellar biogenesis protein FliO